MEDLLLWSKSQMKNFTPQYKMVKIAPLLSQEITLFEEQVQEKDLRITLNVSNDFSKNTDENFLAVILRNLMQNAIKQSDNKSAITINADANIISITNSAGNKNADDLNSILEQTQVSSKNSGLGLQIVKDLATRLGIKIYFQQNNMEKITTIVQFG